MRHLKKDAEEKKQLIETVGEINAKLAAIWGGMPPYQVAEAIRSEYVDRFFGKIEFPLSGKTALNRYLAQHTFKLKAGSWLDLDDSLKHAASYVKDDLEALRFWDHMRYIAYHLKADPGTRARRALQRIQEKENADLSKIYRMKFCRFCWRSVLVCSPVSTQYFCPEHWLSSRSAEYARLNRLRKKTHFNGTNAIDFYTEVILTRLKGEEWGDIQLYGDYTYCIDLFNRHKHKLVEAWDNLRIFYPGLIFLALPLVQQYLRVKSIRLTSISEVVHGLESPSPLNDKKLEFFRYRYYKDFEFYFHEYYPTLARAEAWMLLETECEHGGKRSGAGRKKKV